MKSMAFVRIDENGLAVMRGVLDSDMVVVARWNAESLRKAIENHSHAGRHQIAAECQAALDKLIHERVDKTAVTHQ